MRLRAGVAVGLGLRAKRAPWPLRHFLLTLRKEGRGAVPTTDLRKKYMYGTKRQEQQGPEGPDVEDG